MSVEGADLAHLADAARNGTCPFCDRGPWRGLAKHVARKHGIGERDLKQRLGIPWSHGLNAPDVEERQRQQRRAMGAHPNLTEAARGSSRAANTSAAGREGRRRNAVKQGRTHAERTRKIPVESLPELQRRHDAGERLADLAAEHGATAPALSMALARWRREHRAV